MSSLFQIPSLPTGLFVSAKGEGCCLMQVRRQGHQVFPGAPGTWGRPEGRAGGSRLNGGPG